MIRITSIQRIFITIIDKMDILLYFNIVFTIQFMNIMHDPEGSTIFLSQVPADTEVLPVTDARTPAIDAAAISRLGRFAAANTAQVDVRHTEELLRVPVPELPIGPNTEESIPAVTHIEKSGDPEDRQAKLAKMIAGELALQELIAKNEEGCITMEEYMALAREGKISGPDADFYYNSLGTAEGTIAELRIAPIAMPARYQLHRIRLQRLPQPDTVAAPARVTTLQESAPAHHTKPVAAPKPENTRPHVPPALRKVQLISYDGFQADRFLLRTPIEDTKAPINIFAPETFRQKATRWFKAITGRISQS